MANEAREAAWQAYFTTIKNIPHGPMPYTAFKAGYAAHESAIRAAAVALVETSELDIDHIEQAWAYYQSIRTTAQPTIKIAKAKRSASLSFLANQIPKLVAEIRETRHKLAALKAELETPTGKEIE